MELPCCHRRAFFLAEKICAAAVFLLLFAACCAAAPGEYLIETWDTSSGLPQNTVRCIAQTPDGYLWIGTENGLARFDGVRFENFVRENTPALVDPNVETLILDANGSLWAGTSAHAAKWDGRRLTDSEWPLALNDWPDRCLVTSSNEMVFSTLQGCLIRGRLSESGRWQWSSSRPAEPSDFAVDGHGDIWRLVPGARMWRMTQGQPMPVSVDTAAGRKNVLVADAAGQVWLGTEHQLLRQEGGQFLPVAPPPGQQNFNVTQLFPTRDGALWVMANQHVWKYSHGAWVLDAGAWPYHARELTRFIEDRRGNVWFGNFGAGLVRITRDGKISTLTAQDGLPGDRVRCVFQDREGNLWVGVDRGGLARLRERQFQVLGTDDGLSDPVALGVCEDAAGAIWVATYGGGLNRWADGEFSSYNFGPDGAKGYIFTVFPDREGRLWVGTRDTGVFVMEGGRFRQAYANNAVPVPTRAIFEDHAGDIWLGTGFGAVRWHNGKAEHFANDTEIARADIRAFAENPDGSLWIGTHGDGLHRFLNGRHTAWHVADGLPNEYIRSLFADSDGTLWIGLYGGGLFRWKDGRLARAAPVKDLPDDVICNFEDDGSGRFWISTHHGLFRVAKAELNDYADGKISHVACIAYGKYDGLPTVEFSGGVQPSGWRARDGRLWFPTGKGLVSLQPAAVTVNPLPPSVVVESLLVDGEIFAAATDQGPAVPDIGQALRVPAGRTQFEFRFTGLSFSAPDKVRFQYRLENLQKNWVEAGMNRSVTFSYLPPGAYNFHVRAANNDGVWNEEGAAVGFEVLPHFWQRWWFRILVAAAVVGLVSLAYYIRMARLRELERLRLRIARDLHDDVGANLASLALIAEAMEKQPAFGDPADLRRIAVSTIDSLRDIVWFIDPARDNLGELVTRMRDTAPTLLTGLKFNFQTHVPSPGIHLPPAFRRNIFPIFKEALHNAMRHAHASRVDIELDCRDGGLRLKITDDGQGFDEPAIIPGNGLRNLRRRAAEMRGSVLVRSRPGQGTTVDFYAPFPQMRGLGFSAHLLSSQTLARKSRHPERENRDHPS